jgi:uncharacterized protein YecT (DUF1311 family)
MRVSALLVSAFVVLSSGCTSPTDNAAANQRSAPPSSPPSSPPSAAQTYPSPDEFAKRWNSLVKLKLLKISRVQHSGDQDILWLNGADEITYFRDRQAYTFNIEPDGDMQKLMMIGATMVETLAPEISDADMRELLREAISGKTIPYDHFSVSMTDSVMGHRVEVVPRDNRANADQHRPTSEAEASAQHSMVPDSLSDTKCGRLAKKVDDAYARGNIGGVGDSLSLVFRMEHCDDKSSEGWKPKEAPQSARVVTTPPFAVSSVELGAAIDAGQEITQPKSVFAPSDSIYAAIASTGAASHVTLAARWSYQDGQIVNASSQEIAPTGPAVTTFHISKPDGWPVGEYTVEVLVNDVVAVRQHYAVRDELVAEPSQAISQVRVSTSSQQDMRASGIPPSFDCRRATTATENAICASSELSSLDGELGRAFSDAIARLPPDQLKIARADQNAWIKVRDNACNGNATCLSNYLRQRISELRNITQN